MEAAGGLASPTGPDDDGMQKGVPVELREQALGLISDAQTAGDRKEKEALLKQVFTKECGV